MGDIFTYAFNFFNSIEIAGLSLTIWFVIVLVLTAIIIFVRGNK